MSVLLSDFAPTIEALARQQNPQDAECGLAALGARVERLEALLIGDEELAYQPTVRLCLVLVHKLTDVSPLELTGACRGRRIARARFMAYWLAKRVTNVSYPEIGRRIGNRDHTTVLSGVRRAERLRDLDKSFRDTTDALLSYFILRRG